MATLTATERHSPHRHGSWRTAPLLALLAGVPLTVLAAGATGAVRAALLCLLAALTTAAATFGDRIVAATARVALAVAAVSVGIGIGLSFAARSGALLPAALGLLALVGGLALLGWAVRAFLRGTPGWWRLTLLPVAVVVLAAVYVVVPAVLATTPPPAPLGTKTPAAYGLAYRSVTLRTSDGVRLSGWYVPSTNGAALLLMHGSGSNRTGTLAQAAVLARHGYGALLLDARGHGDSAGHGMDFGWYGERDIAAAVGWLQRQPDVRAGRIGVLGLSMGGEEAIGAAGADPRIRAVVAEGVTGRTAADKASWLPGGATGAVQRVLDRTTYGLTDLLTDAPLPRTLRESAARVAPRPILLICAGTKPDEARAAAAIRSATPATVRVWVVPHAGHTGGLSVAPGEWEARVIGFLATGLAAV
jgi:uncharacterized protein